MGDIKEFSRNDRVIVANVCAWDIGFHSDIARRDIVIPGFAERYALLTVDQVEDEIIKQNAFFVGTDGLGNHASIKIIDPDMYKFLFRVDDETKHFTKDVLIEVLKISAKTKFTEAVEDMIQTRSEARMCLYYLNDISWSDYLGWKKDAILAKCREFYPEYRNE